MHKYLKMKIFSRFMILFFLEGEILFLFTPSQAKYLSEVSLPLSFPYNSIYNISQFTIQIIFLF